jgi:AcrR family transcriptional regulator
MPHINKKRGNTRLEIIRLGAHLFIEEGYSCTTVNKIAKTLDLSPGNVTFYFPTKEHLLAVLVDELFDFQTWLMEYEAREGASSLLSYCLELTSIAAACEDDEVAKDFFASSYSSAMILNMIRENDTEKTKKIFAEYRPDWSDEEWRATENIVSGIEFATIMTCEAETPLDKQIEKALDSIMLLYGVPEELRRQKIEKVLAMDYRNIGKRILKGFKDYIDKVNEENLKQSRKNK